MTGPLVAKRNEDFFEVLKDVPEMWMHALQSLWGADRRWRLLRLLGTSRRLRLRT